MRAWGSGPILALREKKSVICRGGIELGKERRWLNRKSTAGHRPHAMETSMHIGRGGSVQEL